MPPGRPEKDRVKVNKTGSKGDSVNLVPVSNSQLDEAGVDPTAEVSVKRTVRKGKKEILLELEEED